jgi:uncharacterized membrane protein (DUF106 family)
LIENFDFNFLTFFLNNINLQANNVVIWGIFGFSRDQLGNGDPIIKGIVPSLFGVAGFGILVGIFNSLVRKKVVDQKKMKMLIKETKEWKNQKINALKNKDNEKILELNKKTSYMNKMSLEIMQMNMKPMMFTFVPLMLIYYFVLPQLFSNTVAISPISLDIFPGNFFHLTCTAEQAVDPNNICTEENSIYRWAWYFLSSIAFSGLIMRITRTSR